MARDMKLVHYSASHVAVVRDAPQKPMPDFKPQGFWLSCDGFKDNWRQWCIDEDWSLRNLTHVHDVRLSKSASILRLRSAEDIDAFTKIYQPELTRWEPREIQWRNVAANYQGIIIAPYVWERRLGEEARWYYTWDCASGCIWDASAIAKIELRRPTFDEFRASEQAAA